MYGDPSSCDPSSYVPLLISFLLPLLFPSHMFASCLLFLLFLRFHIHYHPRSRLLWLVGSHHEAGLRADKSACAWVFKGNGAMQGRAAAIRDRVYSELALSRFRAVQHGEP